MKKLAAAIRDLVLNGRHPYYEPPYYVSLPGPSSPPDSSEPYRVTLHSGKWQSFFLRNKRPTTKTKIQAL